MTDTRSGTPLVLLTHYLGKRHGLDKPRVETRPVVRLTRYTVIYPHLLHETPTSPSTVGKTVFDLDQRREEFLNPVND